MIGKVYPSCKSVASLGALPSFIRTAVLQLLWDILVQIVGHATHVLYSAVQRYMIELLSCIRLTNLAL